MAATTATATHGSPGRLLGAGGSGAGGWIINTVLGEGAGAHSRARAGGQGAAGAAVLAPPPGLPTAGGTMGPFMHP